jgi:hypothetical protein
LRKIDKRAVGEYVSFADRNWNEPELRRNLGQRAWRQIWKTFRLRYFSPVPVKPVKMELIASVTNAKNAAFRNPGFRGKGFFKFGNIEALVKAILAGGKPSRGTGMIELCRNPFRRESMRKEPAVTKSEMPIFRTPDGLRQHQDRYNFQNILPP